MPSFGPLMVSGSVDEIFPNFGTPTTTMSTPGFQISPELIADRFFDDGLSSRNSSLLQSQLCGIPLQIETALLHSPRELLSATTQIPSNDFDGILQAGTAVFDVFLQGEDSDRPLLRHTPELRDPETLQLPTVCDVRPLPLSALANYSAANRQARLQSRSSKVDQSRSDSSDKSGSIKLEHSGFLSEADASIQSVFESIGLTTSWQETGNIDISSTAKNFSSTTEAAIPRAQAHVLRSPALAREQSSSIFLPHIQNCSPSHLLKKLAQSNQETLEQSIPGHERGVEELQPQNIASLDARTQPPWAQRGSIVQSLANLSPTNLRRQNYLEKIPDPAQSSNGVITQLPRENADPAIARKRKRAGLETKRRKMRVNNVERERPVVFPDLENFFSEPTSVLRGAVTNRKRRKRDESSTNRNRGKERLANKDDGLPNAERSVIRAAPKASASQSGRANSPSHFCHICTRADRSMPVALCGNFAQGKCRKVICAKCARDNGWADALAAIANPAAAREWSCAHCCGLCPYRAQCNTYGRINKLRREKRMSAAGNAALTPQGHPASEVTEDWLSLCQPHESSRPDAYPS
jgi:hypothetical protein